MPRASAPPGAGLRKPAKVRRTPVPRGTLKNGLGRTRREIRTKISYSQMPRSRRAYYAYFANQMARDRAREPKKTKRDLALISKYLDSPAMDRKSQRKTELFIEQLQREHGNKARVEEVLANAKIWPAGYYLSPGGGLISLSDEYSSLGKPNKPPKLTKSQLSKLTPAGRRFYAEYAPSQYTSAKQDRLAAKKILLHEYAHALQANAPGGFANPNWWVEGSAELKARKEYRKRYPKAKRDYAKTYKKEVKRVKRYRKQYGRGSSPYSRSKKIAGVPISSPELAARYLTDKAVRPLPLWLARPIYDEIGGVLARFGL